MSLPAGDSRAATIRTELDLAYATDAGVGDAGDALLPKAAS
jgi:hypothetical protein